MFASFDHDLYNVGAFYGNSLAFQHVYTSTKSNIHTVMFYGCFTLEQFDFCQQTLDVSCVALVNILFSRHHSITYHTYQLCTSSELHFFCSARLCERSSWNQNLSVCSSAVLSVLQLLCLNLNHVWILSYFSNWLPWTIHSNGFAFVKKKNFLNKFFPLC